MSTKHAPACGCLRQNHREVEVQLDRSVAALQRLGPDSLRIEPWANGGACLSRNGAPSTDIVQ